MDYKADAEKVKKHFSSMVEAGGALLDMAGAYNPILAVFQDGADVWVPDNGNQNCLLYTSDAADD